MTEELLRVEVGLKIGDQNRLEPFGHSEVNRRLQQGLRIIRIEEGRAILSKVGEDAQNVKVQFRGFSLVVVFESLSRVGPLQNNPINDDGT